MNCKIKYEDRESCHYQRRALELIERLVYLELAYDKTNELSATFLARLEQGNLAWRPSLSELNSCVINALDWGRK